MKPAQRIILTTLALCCAMVPAVAQQRASVAKVVIDAGHGGKDPGAVNKKLLEKDINLAVALRLGKLINQHYPDVTVVYTRKTDVFIPLDQRGDIANKAGADLFISIHTNAAKNTAASGIETYVMGVDKENSNLSVAMRENDVVVYESDYSTKYQGYEPGSAESFIIFSLMQYSYLDQSMQFARLAQQHYCKNLTLPDRGVKQAGFLVLWRTAMPSVLTELGYIGNDKDAAQLSSEKGRDAYARSLFNAFSAYKTKVEGKGALITLADQPDTAVGTTESAAVSTPPEAVAASGKGYIFAVQVGASAAKMPLTAAAFKGLPGKVFEYKEDRMYRYYVGECETFAQAVKVQAEVRRVVKDAFVVALRDGKKIVITEQMKK